MQHVVDALDRSIGNLGFEALALSYQLEESKEGVNAFKEKRLPNFKGC